MKKYKFWFFITILAAFLVYPLFSDGKLYAEEDNYGKVIGQIVDTVTREPIKESFYIYIFYSKRDDFPENIYRWWDETDDLGRFKLELVPNTYYLQFKPISSKSKYCITPYPYKIEEGKRDIIKVETGKITFFKKKAVIGGILKIFLADENNVRFNPKQKFQQKFKIKSIVCGNVYNSSLEGEDDLNDGEQSVSLLHEGKYRIHVMFEGLGFKDFKKDNIPVEKGKINEFTINLDLNDTTGIEGFVTDFSGVPVEDSYILLAPINNPTCGTVGFEASANKEGFYSLKGMPEGKYYLSYHYYTKNNRSFGNHYGYVDIKKNVLLRMDFKFEETLVEMEKQ